MGKIVSKEEFKSKIRPRLRSEGKTIVLCHGVFDLVHPGHILHFEQAKSMGDVLVVSITAARFVRKGPGRPYFDDKLRMKFLEAIGCIDYVLLSECYTVDDIVESVEPDIYVKGSEYADEEADLTGKIREERELVERHGGRVGYTDGQVFSSTRLLNTAMSALPDNVRTYMEDFKAKYSMNDLRAWSQRAGELKILVLGDVIIDRYTYCSVQGLMSKDMGYSARERYSEEYLGGSVAVARHLASFSDHVSLMSIIGNEQSMHRLLTDSLDGSIRLRLIHSGVYPTIVKQRYLTKNDKRDEYKKIFAVNNIPERQRFDDASMAELKARLKDTIAGYDVVFLCDFGHGLVDEGVIRIVEDGAKYLALNCQSNSSNFGMNVITKYHRADAFSLDQKELKLAFPALADREEEALKALGKHLHSPGWLTRGSEGAWGVEGDAIYNCPALTLTVKDTIGAGDAFYSVAGIYAAAGAPPEVGTLLGNIAGALGANIVGNKSAVEKVNVLKYANTLMNV